MLKKPFLRVALALTAALATPPGASFAQSGGDGYAPPWQKGDQYGDAPRPITPKRNEGDRPADRPTDRPADRRPADGSGDRYDERSGGRNSDNGPPPSPSYRGDYAGRGDYTGASREERETFSAEEVVDAGHGFFGSVSKGLADVVEHTFSRHGRPTGYILGEEGGGAYIAGLRYGEGKLFTKHLGSHKVFWQGPSLGIDFGGDGSKTMVLVYNLRYPEELFDRFGGMEGSAYAVGGVGVTFLTRGDMVLAPIRSGVGLRLGANVGYLKYTPYPTWNPF
jgi:hypothetical protein